MFAGQRLLTAFALKLFQKWYPLELLHIQLPKLELEGRVPSGGALGQSTNIVGLEYFSGKTIILK